MNKVKDTRKMEVFLNVYRKLSVKKFFKKIWPKAIICICIGLSVNLLLKPYNKNYIDYMTNPRNYKPITLSDFDEISKIQDKGTIYISNEFKVEYDLTKDIYKLFTIYNPRIPMSFDSSLLINKAMELFKLINSDNYVLPEHFLEAINFFNPKSDLELGNKEYLRVDQDVYIRISKQNSDKIFVELMINRKPITFYIEENVIDIFIDDLFSVRNYTDSGYISLVTNGSSNKDLKKRLDNYSNKYFDGAFKSRDNDENNIIFKKELSLVPNALLEELSKEHLLEIVSNNAILKKVNESSNFDFHYTISGYYSPSKKYILIGNKESNVRWALLHEIGHAFDSLENLSSNMNIYLSYKRGEVFFNDNYAYVNIGEYIAETFVLKMRGLLDKDTLINKEYDKILKKYQ